MADTRPQSMLDYYAKNNSIGLMDSLLMNRQIIKSGIGCDTTAQPLTTDRYDTVNSIGDIVAVTGLAITMKAQPGFNIPGDPVIPYNATTNFGIARYYYEDGYGFGEKPTLVKNWEIFNGVTEPEPEPEE